MKSIKNVLILGIIVLLSADAAAGQTENDLKNYFEGRRVEAKIEMPATKDGIDVYPERDRRMNYGDYADRLKSSGVGVREGDRMMITKIKVKGKHIEFHLGGGGYGTFGDETGSSVSVPVASKSQREKNLERNLKDEPDERRRRRMRAELNDLRREREYENNRNRAEAAAAQEIAKIRIQEKRLQGGSRFNIRFDRKIIAQDLTPQTIMTTLAEYLYFPDLQ